jgi:hypothetical protein
MAAQPTVWRLTRTRLLAAALSAGVGIVGIGSAAAAAGVLPASVQGAAHVALASAGIDVPDALEAPDLSVTETPDDGAPGAPADTPTDAPTGTGAGTATPGATTSEAANDAGTVEATQGRHGDDNADDEAIEHADEHAAVHGDKPHPTAGTHRGRRAGGTGTRGSGDRSNPTGDHPRDDADEHADEHADDDSDDRGDDSAQHAGQESTGGTEHEPESDD